MNNASAALKVVETTAIISSSDADFLAELQAAQERAKAAKENDLNKKLNSIKTLREMIAEGEEYFDYLSDEGLLAFDRYQKKLEDLLKDPQVVAFFQKKDEEAKLEQFKKDFINWRYNEGRHEVWNTDPPEIRFFIYLPDKKTGKKLWLGKNIPYRAVYIQVKDDKVFILGCFGEVDWTTGTSWYISNILSIPEFIRQKLMDKGVIYSSSPKKKFSKNKRTTTTNGIRI